MVLPSRREATIPKSARRCIWLDTAWGFMPMEVERSVTHNYLALMRACKIRNLVALAKTLKTAARPPAWTGDSRWRPWSGRRRLTELVFGRGNTVEDQLRIYAINV